MKAVKWLALIPVLVVLFVAHVIADCNARDKNEQNEEARKKLLEKEERDIELDGNE